MLQTAYEMPLSFPLTSRDNLILKEASEIVHRLHGNAFDLAASFMTVRLLSDLKHANQSGILSCETEIEFNRLALGSQRTKSYISRWADIYELIGNVVQLKLDFDEKFQPKKV